MMSETSNDTYEEGCTQGEPGTGERASRGTLGNLQWPGACSSAAEKLSLTLSLTQLPTHPHPACLLSEPGWVWRSASGLANPPEAGPLGRKPEWCMEFLPSVVLRCSLTEW